MPFAEFAAQPFAQSSSLFKNIVNLCAAKLDKNYAGFCPVPSKDNKGPYIYMNTRDLHQPDHTTTNRLWNVEVGLYCNILDITPYIIQVILCLLSPPESILIPSFTWNFDAQKYVWGNCRVWMKFFGDCRGNV